MENRTYWLSRAEWWVQYGTRISENNKVFPRADFAYEIGNAASWVMKCIQYAHEAA